MTKASLVHIDDWLVFSHVLINSGTVMYSLCLMPKLNVGAEGLLYTTWKTRNKR